MSELTVLVHRIEDDGYPFVEDDEMTGRVAFVFDGCVVTGWPLHEYDEDGFRMWEPDSDVGWRKYAGVRYWIEFPKPVWEIGN